MYPMAGECLSKSDYQKSVKSKMVANLLWLIGVYLMAMSVQALLLAVVALNNWQYSYLQLLLLWELSDQSLWTYWHAWGKSSRHTQNSYVIGRVKENALNNPPCPITPNSRHHLYIIHLINGVCTVFYRTTMSHKWSLVPKRDVKQ